ncbi:preprotein translocase subunit YajC [Enterococcus faecalis]|uniref:preprotein translocase subunit YajC n=1 Tax=Enterococcus faecalis TaxID=1351 RepID=UPI000CF2A633|nr:preprotein translocase subunit YajC [Enterococcus faecalis]EGO5030489.1 preprotein translocase subunit YajC [Enterococcus faecalis]EGO5085316.1 preprotein translocase subunit YajC [Enterococcus faecalis]EGO5094358.1 preprotein translocase subunit YajC [Enterococcus faecalis]EGO5157837.1 preprotein translocase subunit YajC [Enterococcus faecalis]EGO6551726.1 preprotein translocase subunit YajC [Enterococcus faecalis]
MLLVIVAMYFYLFRTQKKQQKERQNFLNNLQLGDAVVTIGGLHGVISEISSDKKKVTLDCEGALFGFDQQSIRAKKTSKKDPLSAYFFLLFDKE